MRKRGGPGGASAISKTRDAAYATRSTANQKYLARVQDTSYCTNPAYTPCLVALGAMRCFRSKGHKGPHSNNDRLWA